MTQETPGSDGAGAPVRLRQPDGPADASKLVRADRSTDDSTDETVALVAQVLGFDGRVAPALEWAATVGRVAPLPGGGDTARLWELLASTAAADVGVARILEPHLDALAILAAAGGVDLEQVDAGSTSTWGVYAAEGPGVRVTATQHAGGWTLDGVKPWCSLARDLSHALVTAWTDDGRRLFAVDLRSTAVAADAGPWVARGLAQVVSAPVRFDSAPAVPVGDTGWYLSRPGFAWGGIGVAACWWGGAVGVARDVFAACTRREPDQLALAHLGAIDTALAGARAVLLDAGGVVDGRVRDESPLEPTTPGRSSPEESAVPPGVLARRTRNVVARAVEETLARAAHALGPAPLAHDERHARRVADLALYVRQHHAERDDAALGRDLVAHGTLPW
ncbi:acyl-CoA dehydrogenase family protein [Sanguibacter sp. 25GB23B1]|uniref:acyl-CoA dehydrogenase family protein n=1 Tax=unclassified Sanguibacter TaxID=2645534 RepID=UPI0032AF2A16